MLTISEEDSLYPFDLKSLYCVQAQYELHNKYECKVCPYMFDTYHR